jgi:protease-4
MIGWLIVALRNAVRALRNGWCRLWGRRVDYVLIDVGGALPEFAPPAAWWRRRFLGETAPASLQGLRRQLWQVADDPQACGVILRIADLEAGWATLQSLRDELERFRASGKRVVACLHTATNAGYYAACAADEIVMPPAAFWMVLGVRAEVPYLRDALARYGISAEVVAVSPYKSAAEPFVRSDMSPEAREQLERLVEQRYAELVDAIAGARGLPPDDVRALIDRAPLSAPEALAAGLIDAAIYEDELPARLKQGERDPILADWRQAKRALRLPYLVFRRRLVGVVPVEGTIATGRSRNVPLPIPLFGGQQAGAESVTQALRQAERSRRIAAVVVQINSPGGDAFASDLIWREVLRLRQAKPVVIAMGDAAASGGYYIAAPASAIVAQPGTVTGSIGVFALLPQVSGLLARQEITTAVVSRGAHSGLFSPLTPLDESERAALRGYVQATYDDFRRRVRDGRGLDEARLEPIAGGRVWTGREGVALGLVDELGGLPEALLKAQALAGLPPDRRAPLLLLRGGRERLPPQPFPALALELPKVLDEIARPRIWAALLWECQRLVR